MAQAKQPRRARASGKPWRLPPSDWKLVAIRSWREQAEDNIGLIAAGVAFYGFLALVPLLAATVLTYGLIASPQTVIDNVRHLTTVMPASAARLVGEQLMNVVDTSGDKKGIGLAAALAIALFGARNGAGALITALNIAYEVEETRSFVRVTLLALAMTAAGVVFAIVAAFAIAVIGFVEDLIPFATGPVALAGKTLTYVLLASAGAATAATLYRLGPARHHVRWEWLTPGSLFAAAGWVALTLGFGLYVAHIGHYDATYGSLSAVIILLTWLYLSGYLFLLGAELNSEVEKLLERREADVEGRGAIPPAAVQPPAKPADRIDASAAGEPKHGASAAFRSPCGPIPPRRRVHVAEAAILIGIAIAVVALARAKNPSARA
jgi:membrane protein